MEWFRRISKVPYSKLVWLMPISFTLHELEEWNIMPWYRDNFANPPPTPDYAAQTWLIFISVIGFIITGLACCFKNKNVTATITLTFFIALAFGNSLQHIYWLFSFNTYAPGVVAAVLINIPVIVFMSWHAILNRLILVAYVGILYFVAFAGLVVVIRADNVVTETFLRMHSFSEYLAAALGIGP